MDFRTLTIQFLNLTFTVDSSIDSDLSPLVGIVDDLINEAK